MTITGLFHSNDIDDRINHSNFRSVIFQLASSGNSFPIKAVRLNLISLPSKF